MAGRHAATGFLIATAATTGALMGLLWWANANLLWAYGISVNAAAFLQYGYDKRQAAAHGGRVPEIVLHVTALAGGSLGALAGQRIFRHKTRKRQSRSYSFLS